MHFQCWRESAGSILYTNTQIDIGTRKQFKSSLEQPQLRCPPEAPLRKFETTSCKWIKHEVWVERTKNKSRRSSNFHPKFHQRVHSGKRNHRRNYLLRSGPQFMPTETAVVGCTTIHFQSHHVVSEGLSVVLGGGASRHAEVAHVRI